MASGPCLRRCRVVRRYMPRKIACSSLYVKGYFPIHVSMYFGSFQQLSFVNTGFPPSKVPIRRKLGPGRACPWLQMWHRGGRNGRGPSQHTTGTRPDPVYALELERDRQPHPTRASHQSRPEYGATKPARHEEVGDV